MSTRAHAFIWEQFLLVTIAMTIGFLIVSIPIYFIFKRIDRRDKSGPRCRRCDYDLRASTGASCPECGRDLERKGVWPIGKPNRGPAVIAVLAWSWFMATITLSGVIIYSEYRYQILCHYDGFRDLLVLEEAVSGSGVSIYITGYGESRNWFSLQDKEELPLKYVCIELFDAEGYTATIATIAADTQKLTNPPTDTRASYQTVNNHHGEAAPPEDKTTLDYMLEPLYKKSSRVTVDQALKQDIKQAIVLAERIAADFEVISRDALIDQNRYDDMLSHSSDPPRFAAVHELGDFDVYSEPLPEWGYAITPAAGFLVWIVFLPIIRASIYKRMAANGIPTESN
ncbi:MAG: hypothetical protein AAGI37_14780 [Planctomycetota bacterium]